MSESKFKQRPDIYKGKIKQVGIITEEGKPLGWVISGEDENGEIHPKSCGYYVRDGWELYCGYTIDELREVADEQEKALANESTRA